MSDQPTTLGPYQLIQELGRGRRTIVYKAWQTSLQRPVALKVLRRYDADTLKKFQDEAQLSARLKSPGVRRIHEAGQTSQGHIYVAMEYVERSLKDLLQQRQAQKRTFSRQEASHLLTPIAGALDDMHQQGLVHLDIKPRNILISRAGHAVLADFGIARRRGELTQEGTPLYLSPEQAAGNRPVGPWSDVYSLGVLIYEMVAGRPPFVSDVDVVLIRQHLQSVPPSPRQFNPHLERDLERALLAALSKDPRQRPPSAGALLQATSQRRSAIVLTIVERTSTAIRRRPQVALIPTALIVLSVALSLTVDRESEPTTPTPTSSPVLASTSAPPKTNTPIAPTRTPVAPTKTPTVTQEATTEPSSTPRPSPTATPTPRPPMVMTPVLLEPAAGEDVTITTVTFRWEGRLNANQYFVVHLHHPEDGLTRESEALTATSWTTLLPGDKSGEWRWYVRVVPGDVQSQEQHFWFKPYGQ